MKKLLLFIVFAFMGMKAVAQIGIYNIVATNITNNSVTLECDFQPQCAIAENILGYQISNNPSLSPVLFQADQLSIPGGLAHRTFNVTGLNANTTYYYILWGQKATMCGGASTMSTVYSFTTLNNALPTISNIYHSQNNSATTATINYSLNANNANTTSILKYGTSSGALSSQVTGSAVTGNVSRASSAVLTGLTSGVTYFYQVEATNSVGTVTSTINSFVFGASPAIAEYNFDNTYNNVLGNTPFSTSGSFAFDRNNIANKALQLSAGTEAAILNLPLGNAARTVSIWVSGFLTTSAWNSIFNYGSGTINNSCELTKSYADNKLYLSGYSNDISKVYTAPGAWTHYVATYQPDGTAKIYINGTLFHSGNLPGWNTVNSVFRIGKTINGMYTTQIIVDDLKIYGYALSDTEIANLYANNSLLSSQDFTRNNLKASIFPNPASNNFTIEMENEIKSVEIYSLQGQKVSTSFAKNVNISALSKGVYVVRIEDENNAVTTQKLIIP